MKWYRENTRLLLIIITVIGIAFVAIQVFGHSNYKDMTQMSDGWMVDGESVTLPITDERIEGQTYTIVNHLPHYPMKNMTLCFKSENIFWKVYVDGKLIDEYIREDVDFGSTPGDHWNFVTMPYACSGKTISIEMEVVYAPGSNFIQKVYYGQYDKIYTSLLKSFMPGFMVCQLILILSLVYIVINEAFIRKIRGDRILTYLGLFSVCASIWSASQSPIMTLVFSNGYLVKCATYLMLPFLLGFVIQFYVRYKKVKVSKKLLWMMRLPFFYGILVIIMDAAGFWPFPQSVMVTQAFLVAMVFMVIINSFVTIFQYNKMEHSDRIMFFGNLLMAFMGLIDVYRCYALGVDDYSKNTRFAFMIYTIIIGADQILDFMDYQQMLEESKLMKKIAYIDGLTGVGNRMAFNKKLDELQENIEVGFIHFDINNLKKANDVYGHIVGDKLICLAANAISTSFENVGTCYRYGGDEFTIILEHFDEDRIQQGIDKLNQRMQEMNEAEPLPVPLSIAYGFAHYNPDIDDSMVQVFNRADENMYQKKKQMKLSMA